MTRSTKPTLDRPSKTAERKRRRRRRSPSWSRPSARRRPRRPRSPRRRKRSSAKSRTTRATPKPRPRPRNSKPEPAPCTREVRIPFAREAAQDEGPQPPSRGARLADRALPSRPSSARAPPTTRSARLVVRGRRRHGGRASGRSSTRRSDAEWRGLSLTMPLKQAVIPLRLPRTDGRDRLRSTRSQTGGDATRVPARRRDDALVVRLQHRRRRHRACPARQPDSTRPATSSSSAAERPPHRPWSPPPSSAPSRSTCTCAIARSAASGSSHSRDVARPADRDPSVLGQADRSLDVPDLVVSTLPGGTLRPRLLYTDSTRRRVDPASMSPTTRGRARSRARGRPSAARSSRDSRCSRTRRCCRSASSSRGDPLQPLAGRGRRARQRCSQPSASTRQGASAGARRRRDQSLPPHRHTGSPLIIALCQNR